MLLSFTTHDAVRMPGRRIAKGAAQVVKVIMPSLESETMRRSRIDWSVVRRLHPEDEARAGGPAWFGTVPDGHTVGSPYLPCRETGTFPAHMACDEREGT